MSNDQFPPDRPEADAWDEASRPWTPPTDPSGGTPPPDGPPPLVVELEQQPAAPEASTSQAKRWLAAGIGAVVILAAGAFAIHATSSGSAATPNAAVAGANGTNGANGIGGSSRNGFAGRGPGGFGTIQRIDGSTLTLTTRDGATTTVMLTSSTTYVKDAEGALSDVNVGDHVVVMGSPDSAGTTVAAERIQDTGDQVPQTGRFGQGAPPGAPGAPGGFGDGRFTPPTVGTVASVDGGTLTVTTTDGTTVRVTTSSSTIVTVQTTIAASDLKVGDEVAVRGRQGTDGTITAEEVRTGVSFGRFGGGPGGVGGPGGQDAPPTTS